MSKQSFADLGVSRAVCGALDAEGITEPFAIQSLVVADVLAGRAMRCLTAWHACGSAQFAERFCRAAIQCLPARAPRIAALEDAAVTA